MTDTPHIVTLREYGDRAVAVCTKVGCDWWQSGNCETVKRETIRHQVTLSGVGREELRRPDGHEHDCKCDWCAAVSRGRMRYRQSRMKALMERGHSGHLTQGENP